MDTKKKKSFWKILGIFFVVFVNIGFLSACLDAVENLEHYRRNWENPITVTATVTNCEAYEDDDDDIRYKIYISYTVEDRLYENIFYESSSKRTSLGEKMEVQVSREDPSKLMKNLKDAGTVCIFFPMTIYLISEVISTIFKGLRRSAVGIPDSESVCQDAKLSVLGRRLPWFSLMVTACFAALYFRYSMAMADWFPVVLLICGFVLARALFRFFRDLGKIGREEFEVRTDTLVEKKIEEDDDSRSYLLLYRTNGVGDIWRKSVTQEVYVSARVGQTVSAVYLQGETEPLFHYDEEGKPCNH